MLNIALCYDGPGDPLSLQVENQSNYIGAQRGGVTRNYAFVKALNDGKVLIYKTPAFKLSDKDFEALYQAEADKYLHPERFAQQNGGLTKG